MAYRVAGRGKLISITGDNGRDPVTGFLLGIIREFNKNLRTATLVSC